MELCTYCLMDTNVRHCKVPSHVSARAPQLCQYCPRDTPLSKCEVLAHWDNRLRAYNLPSTESMDDAHAQIDVDGVRTERLVPLIGKHEQIAAPGWTAPISTGITTYRDLNIWERCASPRENSAGWQI